LSLSFQIEEMKRITRREDIGCVCFSFKKNRFNVKRI